MWKKILAIALIFCLIFVMTACTSEDDIKSEEEAAETIGDVSTDISDLSDELEGLSEDLG